MQRRKAITGYDAAMTRLPTLLVTLLCVLPGAAAAESAKSPADVTACMKRNIPEPDSVRGVRFAHRDRDGNRTVTTAKFYGRRNEAGQRQLYIVFVEPVDLKGTSVRIVESPDGGTLVHFVSAEFDKPRKIIGAGNHAPLFGTDLSYEDLEYLHGFDQPGQAKRLPDEEISRRQAYVIEFAPEHSDYERVVAWVDQESCVPLQMRLYESGKRPRKEITTDPKSILKHGDAWVAHLTLVRDLRDHTTTQVFVDSHEQDVEVPKGVFFEVDD
jgi:hypothetical protein